MAHEHSAQHQLLQNVELVLTVMVNGSRNHAAPILNAMPIVTLQDADKTVVANPNVLNRLASSSIMRMERTLMTLKYADISIKPHMLQHHHQLMKITSVEMENWVNLQVNASSKDVPIILMSISMENHYIATTKNVWKIRNFCQMVSARIVPHLPKLEVKFNKDIIQNAKLTIVKQTKSLLEMAHAEHVPD